MNIWYYLFWYLVVGNLIEFGLRPKGKRTLIGVILWPITAVGLVLILIGKTIKKCAELMNV